jgi:hypothetical protein
MQVAHDQPGQDVTGRVSALAISTYINAAGQAVDVLFLGSAGGGVWRSDDFKNPAGRISWKPLTDSANAILDPLTGIGAGTIDVGALAVVRGRLLAGGGTQQARLYVGTGEANYSDNSRYGSGVLRSQNAGDTWDPLETSASVPKADGITWITALVFFRHSISKILIDPTDRGGPVYWPRRGGFIRVRRGQRRRFAIK